MKNTIQSLINFMVKNNSKIDSGIMEFSQVEPIYSQYKYIKYAFLISTFTKLVMELTKQFDKIILFRNESGQWFFSGSNYTQNYIVKM
jgi:hypothetical protein